MISNPIYGKIKHVPNHQPVNHFVSVLPHQKTDYPLETKPTWMDKHFFVETSTSSLVVDPIIQSVSTIRNWWCRISLAHPPYIHLYYYIYHIPKFVGFRFVILGHPISSSSYRTMGFRPYPQYHAILSASSMWIRWNASQMIIGSQL